MKYLMKALIISGTFAIAPAWAQTPMTPPQTKAVTESGHRATTRHHIAPPRFQNSVANQLNAEELATLQTGPTHAAGSPIQRMPSGGKQLTSDR
jgi:hypothetical protein